MRGFDTAIAEIERGACLSDKGIVGYVCLKAAALAAAAERAVKLDLGVADFHAKAVCAAIEAVVEDQAHAQTVGVSWSNFQEERWKTDEAAIKGALDAAGATYVSSDAQ